MTTAEVITAAQALLADAYIAGAIGSVIVVAVGSRLFRMFLRTR